jgi:DNA-binding transcriptional ArsR family regulator
MQSSLDQTLAALADPTRREVIDLLRKRPLKPSDIADELSMSRPALSRHLRVLRRAGLVAEEVQAHDARVRLYELKKERFDELQGWLEEVGEFWDTQLGAFKAHAERKRRP